MSKKENKKGRFGVSTEDVYELRKAMRGAAEIKGPDIVIELANKFSQVSAGDINTACLLVDINMTRAAFGTLQNAVEALTHVPKVKINKYADKIGRRKGMDAEPA